MTDPTRDALEVLMRDVDAATPLTTTPFPARRRWIVGKHDPEYRRWIGMKSRCKNPNDIAYKYYGERGIKVCARWDASFDAFISDMGRPPWPGASLDRIDPAGNYEPDNCRWANSASQGRNKRGVVLCAQSVKEILSNPQIPARELAAKFGVEKTAIIRVRSGRTWAKEGRVSLPSRAKSVKP